MKVSETLRDFEKGCERYKKFSQQRGFKTNFLMGISWGFGWDVARDLIGTYDDTMDIYRGVNGKISPTA